MCPPSLPSPVQMRVEAAGGYVWFDRVMGELAVSRAIGDHCLRPYVIAVPDITRLVRRVDACRGGVGGVQQGSWLGVHWVLV